MSQLLLVYYRNKSSTFSCCPSFLLLKSPCAAETETFLLCPVHTNTILVQIIEEKSVELTFILILTPVQVLRQSLTFLVLVGFLDIRALLTNLKALFLLIFALQVPEGGDVDDDGVGVDVGVGDGVAGDGLGLESQ